MRRCITQQVLTAPGPAWIDTAAGWLAALVLLGVVASLAWNRLWTGWTWVLLGTAALSTAATLVVAFLVGHGTTAPQPPW